LGGGRRCRHLKHPATAQGIGDAVAQSRYVADSLLGGGDLGGYARWRDDGAAGHYEWSFRAGTFPRPDAAGFYAGIAADRPTAQAFLDTFTRRTRLSDVITPERSARWRTAAAYDDGLQRIDALLDSLDERAGTLPVPACPDWTVRELLAHVVGGRGRRSSRRLLLPGGPRLA
jgi:hypothetical protein